MVGRSVMGLRSFWGVAPAKVSLHLRLYLGVGIAALFALAIMPNNAVGGVIVRDFQDNLTFEVNFEGSYSDITTTVSDNLSILSFKASEDFIFDNTTYLYQRVVRTYLNRTGDTYELVTEFRDETPVEPIIEKTNTGIAITYVGVGIPVADVLEDQPTASLGAFSVRAIIFLIVFISLALGLVWVLKKSFKRVAITEVRGVARVLGRLDIHLRKSLYFCEVGEKVYILGVTDDNIGVVDILADEEEIARIKAGFSRREDFGSYLRFFNTRNDASANLSTDVPAGSGGVGENLIADSISADTNANQGRSPLGGKLNTNSNINVNVNRGRPSRKG